MWVSRVIGLTLLATHVPVLGTARSQEIRISHQWEEHTDARDRAARIFAHEAQMRAWGLKFSVHPNSSLNIKPRELLDALQNNKLEMAIFPLVYAAPKVPEFLSPGCLASCRTRQQRKP